jgi:hypothetical protein
LFTSLDRPRSGRRRGAGWRGWGGLGVVFQDPLDEGILEQPFTDLRSRKEQLAKQYREFCLAAPRILEWLRGWNDRCLALSRRDAMILKRHG